MIEFSPLDPMGYLEEIRRSPKVDQEEKTEWPLTQKQRIEKLLGAFTENVLANNDRGERND